MKGYIQLYTGHGKGKTTAALGLAIRAIGAGKTVYVGQFVKGMPYSELEALKRFPEITIVQYGLDCFIQNEPTENDIQAARDGLRKLTSIIENNQYDIVIMDEVCIALYYRLFEVREVAYLLSKKPEAMEIIMTGRFAPQELLDLADLVTEMKEVKHYYKNGVEARKGIEF